MEQLFWLSDEAWAAIERHLPKNQPGAPLFFFTTRDELRASDPLTHEWRDGNGRAVRLI